MSPPPPSQTTRGAVALEDVSFLSPSSSSSLPPEVISAYKDFGFVCLNGFLSQEETEALKERANALEREHRERKKEEDDFYDRGEEASFELFGRVLFEQRWERELFLRRKGGGDFE